MVFFLLTLCFGLVVDAACNQVGTHADSLMAEAVIKGVEWFDQEVAWEAVWKGAVTVFAPGSSCYLT
jgi:hypothetical protein